jgi:eukaryotic-like serine/threonine-protein kinase
VIGAPDEQVTLDEDARRRFESAWRRGAPEPIERCLPSADHPLFLATLEELVHIELEFLWKPSKHGSSIEPASACPRVESYLERFPQLNQPHIVEHLLEQEWEVRQGSGDPPNIEEFQRRFPQWQRCGPADAGCLTLPTKPTRRQPEVPGYEILSEIARGGMGVVYKARQKNLNRLVALKMILHGAYAGTEELQRFRSEARAIAQLAHPNIVQIHEVGEHDGQPYIALEYVDGGSLDRKLAQQLMGPREAAAFLTQLARAVHAVHQRGILHRDLKPANILLSFGRKPTASMESARNDESLGDASRLHEAIPKIADFGLAKRDTSLAAAGAETAGAAALTQTGAVMGTPCYMAPEQAEGKLSKIGPATDVYALGAILYECITRRPPFRADTPHETLRMVCCTDPVAPRRLNSAVPRDLETICLKCLRKEPSARYATALELATDLQRFLDGEPIQARRAGLLERSVRIARRHPTAMVTTALAIVILAGLLLVLRYWPRSVDEEPIQIEYFANYVKRWGVPEGIGRLSEEEARHGMCTLKFYTRGGKVEKVEAVNGEGFPTVHL